MVSGYCSQQTPAENAIALGFFQYRNNLSVFPEGGKNIRGKRLVENKDYDQ